MTIRLEHANLSVHNINEMIRFLQTAFPDFKIRHDDTNSNGKRWVHIGTDSCYMALNQATEYSDKKWVPYGGAPGVNHLAYEVSDVDAIYNRLKAAGYKDTTVTNKHPHRKRIYFNDTEGNDWEFVQYFSEKGSERNDYNLFDG